MSYWRTTIKPFLARLLRQRITRAGIGYSLTISVTGSLAFLTGNNLLFLLLGFLLAVLLLSNFLSRLSLAGLELDFVFPDHVSARRQVPARLKLKNEKSWMPSYSIYVSGAPGSAYSSVMYFPMLAAGATAEETVNVYFARRGQHRENSFELRSRFPFGFTERNVSVALRREALVYPCLDPKPIARSLMHELDGALESLLRGRGHDFYRIRPYEHGESARHVDWRATAHTGQLQVREFAREQEPLVEIYLDTAITDDQRDWFEDAVDCCAFLSWEVTRRGARLRFRTYNFDRQVPLEADVYTILKFLALVEPAGNRGVLGPDPESNLHVALSARPAKLAAAGWDSDHLVGPNAFRAGEPSAAQPGA